MNATYRIILISLLPSKTGEHTDTIDRHYRKRLRTMLAIDEMNGQIIDILTTTGQIRKYRRRNQPGVPGTNKSLFVRFLCVGGTCQVFEKFPPEYP
jgi:hypothetical protein